MKDRELSHKVITHRLYKLNELIPYGKMDGRGVIGIVKAVRKRIQDDPANKLYPGTIVVVSLPKVKAVGVYKLKRKEVKQNDY